MFSFYQEFVQTTNCFLKIVFKTYIWQLSSETLDKSPFFDNLNCSIYRGNKIIKFILDDFDWLE